MNKFFNKAFVFGFFAGFFLFVGTNLFIIWRDGTCQDYSVYLGFPLPFFSPSCDYSLHIVWQLLVIDILLILICSLVIGLIFKFIWSKITARKLELGGL